MSVKFEAYKRDYIKRFDDDKIIKYFSCKDFKGLNVKNVSFTTPQKNTVQGYIYSYKNYNHDDLVVFCHGLGGGHRSYMREIEVLCKKGYRVFAYDCVGCFTSSGDSINGITESLNDLDCCLKFIKKDRKLNKLNLILIGHSMGGYTVGNILNFYDNFKCVVIISPFVSVEDFAQSFYGDKETEKEILDYERSLYPQFADCNMVTSLQNTRVKALVIHSVNDQMIKIENGLYKIKNNVTNPLVEYLVVENKFHNPNYKLESVQALNKVFGEYLTLIANGKLSAFEEKQKFMADKDFYFMTEQDDEVWSKIFEFIK